MSSMPGLFDGTPLERPVTCEVCERPLEECSCPRDAKGGVLLPKDQPARVHCERRRGGRLVTIITGLDLAASDLHALLKHFKLAFAAGGAVNDDRIEIQGDHRDGVVTLLRQMGYPAKVAGG